MEGISICIQTSKDVTVNVSIHIPTDRLVVECEQGIEVNGETKNHKDIDLGYELEEMAKKWCDDDDEGRIYDNLD